MLSTAAAAGGGEEGGMAGQGVGGAGGKGELSAAAAGRSNLKYLRICRSSSVLEIGAYCVSAMSFHLTCHLSLGRGGSKLSLSRSRRRRCRRTTTRQLGATRRGSSSFQLRANWSSFYFLPVDFFPVCLPPSPHHTLPRLPFKRLHLFN